MKIFSIISAVQQSVQQDQKLLREGRETKEQDPGQGGESSGRAGGGSQDEGPALQAHQRRCAGRCQRRDIDGEGVYNWQY